MADRNSVTGRIRVVGLVSSVIAVVALGLTVLAGNRNLGRNETITQPQQIFLLLAAAVLFVVQAALYLSIPPSPQAKLSRDHGVVQTKRCEGVIHEF